MTHFIIAYHISLVKVQANYCNNNLLILDVKQLNKIMKYPGMTRVKLKCIIGCLGLKSNYLEKGLLQTYNYIIFH